MDGSCCDCCEPVVQLTVGAATSRRRRSSRPPTLLLKLSGGMTAIDAADSSSSWRRADNRQRARLMSTSPCIAGGDRLPAGRDGRWGATNSESSTSTNMNACQGKEGEELQCQAPAGAKVDSLSNTNLNRPHRSCPISNAFAQYLRASLTVSDYSDKHTHTTICCGGGWRKRGNGGHGQS